MTHRVSATGPGHCDVLGVPSVRVRLFAMAYEGFLVFAVAWSTLLLFPGAAERDLAGWWRHAAQLYLLLAIGAYLASCWVKGGQTLAMRTWRIKLVCADGSSLTLGRAAARYLLACLLLPPGVAILWAFADPDRQFLHDRLAGTRLVSIGSGRRNTNRPTSV